MTAKRFTIVYDEQSKMMQYVDNCKEEPNRWAIWNASETAQKLNELNNENEQLKQFQDTVFVLLNEMIETANHQKLKELREILEKKR